MKITISKTLTDTDFQKFKDFFSETIMYLYPNSTLKTAESIIEKHKLGFDNKGYFTKCKTIWKGLDEFGNIVAFTVISEKRGGSIKFGPTMVDKEKRKQGIGSTFRLLVENYYQDLGYRKAYSTTDVKNYAGVYYILKIGYKVELHLQTHYSKSSDELILSKMLNSACRKETRSIIQNAPQYITDYMERYYDDIDERFFDNINKTTTTHHSFTEDCYVNKKKYVFRDDLKELYAVVSPKRGGCIKVAPLILSSDEKNNIAFVQNIIENFKNAPIHKLYTFVPVERYSDVVLLKKIGFYTEGIISEPYKKNIDLIMLSYLK
jgi:GNAT superfamily N-acetyltransferase